MKLANFSKKFKILEAVTKNPLIKNNELSRKLGVSEPTVAKYRREMEEAGILRYFAYVDNSKAGLDVFGARKLYMLHFKRGITRKRILDVYFPSQHKEFLFNKHVHSAYLGDRNGRVVLILLLESRVRGDFIDIINGEIIPMYSSQLGEDCIDQVEGIDVENTIRTLHNYTGDEMAIASKNVIYVTDKD